MATTYVITTTPQQVPLTAGNQLMIVENLGRDTVYYAFSSNVSSQTNNGEILGGQSTQFYSGPVWFAATASSSISVTYIPSASAPTSILSAASASANQIPVANGSTGYSWVSVLPDSTTGRYNAGNSGAAFSGSGDDTPLLQAYLNAVSAAVSANPYVIAHVDLPAGKDIRVQNLVIPPNVCIDMCGSRFRYVDASLNPPTGPGNYHVRHYGFGGQLRNGYIQGQGNAAPGVGGIWTMPPGGFGVSSAQATHCNVENVTINNVSGRAVMSQGVAVAFNQCFAQNALLGATNVFHFMGVFEEAGTDCYQEQCEWGGSVLSNTFLNGQNAPRCPNVYDAPAQTTTNGTLNLPISNGSIALTSTSNFSTSGGLVSIGGHLITYTGASGGNLTGCTCGDTATVTTGTSVFYPTGFVVGCVFGGASNHSNDVILENNDVGGYMGPNLLANATSTATLTTTPQTLPVDFAGYFLTSGGTLCTYSIASSAVTFNQFTYTSISETTLTATAALSTNASTVQVGSTTGWPSSGTFHAGGWTVTYTSIVDSTHLGGCTLSAGSVTLGSGQYIRADALNGAAVASSSLTLTAGTASAAILSVNTSTDWKIKFLRAELSMSHGIVFGAGNGQLQSPRAQNNAKMGNKGGNGFHVVKSSATQFDVDNPINVSTDGSQVYYAIVDNNASATNYNRWINPRPGNAFAGYFTGNSAGGWFTIARSPGLKLTVNSTTPSVLDNSVAVCANTGATTITNFTNGIIGQDLVVLQDANTTIANGASIVTKSGANITPPASGFAALRFVFCGFGTTPTPAWYQV